MSVRKFKFWESLYLIMGIKCVDCGPGISHWVVINGEVVTYSVCLFLNFFFSKCLIEAKIGLVQMLNFVPESVQVEKKKSSSFITYMYVHMHNLSD